MVKAAGHGDFADERIEVIGEGNEATVRISVKHMDGKALKPLQREAACAAVSMAQGGMVAPGNQSRMLSAFCFTEDKANVPCYVDVGNGPVAFGVETKGGFVQSA